MINIKENRVWICDECGGIFESLDECRRHENNHITIRMANEMFSSGSTLGDLNRKFTIWGSVPDEFEQISNKSIFEFPRFSWNKENLYKVSEISMDRSLIYEPYCANSDDQSKGISRIMHAIRQQSFECEFKIILDIDSD